MTHKMLFLITFLTMLGSLFAGAAPTGDSVELSTIEPGYTVVDLEPTPDRNYSGKSLSSRQLPEAGSTVGCCTNCAMSYSYSTFWQTFDNLCSWAGGYLELVSTQIYYTQNYYCVAGSSVCIHLEIQFLGEGQDGNDEVVTVDYDGCMGYFMMAIDPVNTCGGPPYPGARMVSPGGNWVFQATADTPRPASRIELEEGSTVRSYPALGVNSTIPAGSEHTFGEPQPV